MKPHLALHLALAATCSALLASAPMATSAQEAHSIPARAVTERASDDEESLEKRFPSYDLTAAIAGRPEARIKFTRGSKRKMSKRLDSALEWLALHQDPAGFWSSESFNAQCQKVHPVRCTGPGQGGYDIAVTGLALLALMGEGSTMAEGHYKDQVAAGIEWLMAQQVKPKATRSNRYKEKDFFAGLLGDKEKNDRHYAHAIATIALCEAYSSSKDPNLKLVCEEAVTYILCCRNPYGAWRYDNPPMGYSDTSVTGWMFLALNTARSAGLCPDKKYAGAKEGTLTWLDECTNPSTWRVGYDGFGNARKISSRVYGVNDEYPLDIGEAPTAIALFTRIHMGFHDAKRVPHLEGSGDLLLQKLPEWTSEGPGNDMYYWFFGSYAMHQLGGKYWKKWSAAMQENVYVQQREEGGKAGSWDPVGPWGFAGGRVYSTALMALSIEADFRLGRASGKK